MRGRRDIDSPEYEKVRNSLAEVGYETVVDMLATYLGRGRDLGSLARRRRDQHRQESTPSVPCRHRGEQQHRHSDPRLACCATGSSLKTCSQGIPRRFRP